MNDDKKKNKGKKKKPLSKRAQAVGGATGQNATPAVSAGGKEAQGSRVNVRVKTAKRRSGASNRWLQRQLNDPYVLEARRQGYRSRAVFKIMQIHEKVNLFKVGQKVVDLGAAPGGWTQFAIEKTKSETTDSVVVGIDYLEMDALPGAEIICCDFMKDEALTLLSKALNGEKADIVMSDMAPPTTGHKRTDHMSIMGLVEAAYDFAVGVLNPEGVFLAKLFQGGAQKELLDQMKRDFKSVKHVKPKASRADSSEIYVVATGFRGHEIDEIVEKGD